MILENAEVGSGLSCCLCTASYGALMADSAEILKQSGRHWIALAVHF